jgi:hypothetical protein
VNAGKEDLEFRTRNHSQCHPLFEVASYNRKYYANELSRIYKITLLATGNCFAPMRARKKYVVVRSVVGSPAASHSMTNAVTWRIPPRDK